MELKHVSFVKNQAEGFPSFGFYLGNETNVKCPLKCLIRISIQRLVLSRRLFLCCWLRLLCFRVKMLGKYLTSGFSLFNGNDAGRCCRVAVLVYRTTVSCTFHFMIRNILQNSLKDLLPYFYANIYNHNNHHHHHYCC